MAQHIWEWSDDAETVLLCVEHGEQKIVPPTKRDKILSELHAAGDVVPTYVSPPQYSKPEKEPTPEEPEPHASDLEAPSLPTKVEQEGTAVDILPPALATEAAISRFEKGIDLYKRFRATCYRLTNEGHWINHGTTSKPYFSLQGPGAEALAIPLGIEPEGQLDIYREDLEDATGHFYRYWCKGWARSKTLGKHDYFIGSCDSRDSFFSAQRSWDPLTGEANILKSAKMNWLVNAVSRISGIRRPSPKDLEAAGLNISQIECINYVAAKPMESDKLKPEVKYSATIQQASSSQGKRPGQLIAMTEHGQLNLGFFSRPEELKDVDDWRTLAGRKCIISFSEKAGSGGRVFRNLETFSFSEDSTAPEPDEEALPGEEALPWK